jgi:hypothetical protein
MELKRRSGLLILLAQGGQQRPSSIGRAPSREVMTGKGKVCGTLYRRGAVRKSGFHNIKPRLFRLLSQAWRKQSPVNLRENDPLMRADGRDQK